MKPCYQCDAMVPYLFGDGRCAKCTRLTPAEVCGEEPTRAPARNAGGFVVVVGTKQGEHRSEPMSFKEAGVQARELAAKNKAPVRVVKA